MAIPDPRSKITFSQGAADVALPDVTNASLLIGCGPNLPNLPKGYATGAAVRTAFGETLLTSAAETHFALDTAKHPILVHGTDVDTAGVLHLDTTGIIGTGTAMADETVTPLGDWPALLITWIKGGDTGTSGMVVDVSIDGGITAKRVSVGAATSIEVTEWGIKIDIADAFTAGSVISGWTEPPKWGADEWAAAKAALLLSAQKFSIIHVAEPIVPASDWTLLTGLLNDLEDPAKSNPVRPCTMIVSARRIYQPAEATISATFADANPDTLARASGSFVTDGFKPGMRLRVTGAVNSGNNATFVRIKTVAATLLTMTDNVAFTAEAGTAGVVVSGWEEWSDYGSNVAEEWDAYKDPRICWTVGAIRAARPADGAQPDQTLGQFLWNRVVSTAIQVEPAQHSAKNGGGPVAASLGGRLTEGSTLILPDASMTSELVDTPSRSTALERAADGTGPYFTQARTSAPDSQIDRLIHARIITVAKHTLLSVGSGLAFSSYASDPTNPKKLSAGARAEIESAFRNALRAKIGSAIANRDREDPEGALVEILGTTDLSTGFIRVGCFFRSLFYARGFGFELNIKSPG